jgi:hypothetical protein
MAASQHVITDMNTVITAGPSANTVTASEVPGGRIMDYLGMLHSTRLMMKETLNKLTMIVAATDAADGNLATLQNIVLTYS